MKRFLCALALTASSWAEGKTWAVVVGVDQYVRNSIPKLRYAVADAKLFARALQDSMKLPSEQIFLLTSDAVDENAEPKAINVLYRISWLSKVAKPEDTVIFYFAGHGMTVDGEPFLLTEEADNRQAVTLKKSAIHQGELNTELRNCKVQNCWLVLDACRNSPAGSLETGLSDKAKESALSASIGRSQTATMFACNVGERSWEWDEKKHGCFTYFLVEGLNERADDGQGRVTVDSLFNYVQKEVLDVSRKLGAPQNPTRVFGGQDWVLTTLNKPVAASAKPKTISQYVAELEAVQAKLDRETALRVNAEQKAKLEESRRQELEQRIALLEKQITGKPGMPQAIQVTESDEFKRLNQENAQLHERVRKLEGEVAARVGMVSREVKLEQNPEQASRWRSSEEQMKSSDPRVVRQALSTQMSVLETIYPERVEADRKLAKELEQLEELLAIQRQSSLAIQSRMTAAEIAASEANERLREAEQRFVELNDEVTRLYQELAEMQAKLGECQRQLALAEEQLASMREKYKQKHLGRDPWTINGPAKWDDLIKLPPGMTLPEHY